jgi:hypothetical protein
MDWVIGWSGQQREDRRLFVSSSVGDSDFDFDFVGKWVVGVFHALLRTIYCDFPIHPHEVRTHYISLTDTKLTRPNPQCLLRKQPGLCRNVPLSL